MDNCPFVKVVFLQILKICAGLIKIVLVFDVVAVGLGIAFHRFSYRNSDIFFKHQQHVYICKLLKPKLM